MAVNWIINAQICMDKYKIYPFIKVLNQRLFCTFLANLKGLVLEMPLARLDFLPIFQGVIQI